MVEWKKIEEIGSFFGGLTGKTKNDFVDGNAKFITYMNVFANPSLNPSVVGVVKINEGEKQNKVQRGDILFTGSSETPEEAGMSCVVTDDIDGDYYMNSFCFGLRLFCPEQYNLHYLKHILRSNSVRKKIAKTASGVTRFNISKVRFSKVPIPIPSISEQQCIVETLDTFTASIENLKEQIAQRRKQYEHYRDQLLDLEGKEGVEMKTLKRLCSITGDYGLSAPSKPFDGIRYLRITDITDMGGLNNDRVSADIIDSPKKEPLNEGDILFARTGATVGKTLLYHSEYGECLFAGYLIRYRPNKDVVLPKYLFHFTHSSKYINWVQSSLAAGAQPNISAQKYDRLLIPIPSLSEQSRIVAILDKFEASIANLEEQLALRQKQYEYYRNKLLTFE